MSTDRIVRRSLADCLVTFSGLNRKGMNAILVLVSVAILILSAKIRVPMWPVPMTLQTLTILSIGVGFHARMGITTVLLYLGIGALGYDVFAGSSSTNVGLSYMTGPTGGYLLGFLIATFLTGTLARKGYDRSFLSTFLIMLAGNVAIYVPGLLWLSWLYGAEKAVQWGLFPFLAGDLVKVLIASLLFPALWRRPAFR